MIRARTLKQGEKEYCMTTDCIIVYILALHLFAITSSNDDRFSHIISLAHEAINKKVIAKRSHQTSKVSYTILEYIE